MLCPIMHQRSHSRLTAAHERDFARIHRYVDLFNRVVGEREQGEP